MAEHSVNDLSYGHFGELYYDTGKQQWLAKRHQSAGESLQALSTSKTYVEPAILEQTVSQDPRLYIGNRVEKAWSLLSTIPDFGFAQTTLKNHILDWTEPATKVAEQDWKSGDLLAYAKLRSEHTPGRRIRESNVLAFPSGGAGDVMKLTELREARHGWGLDRKSAWLKTLEIRETGSTTYFADGRIRQICFASNQVDETHPLLAARTAMSITVFLPQVYLSAEPADQANRAQIRSGSRISLQQVFRFSIEGNGLIEFIDMSFNPWFPTTLAAVLEDGRYHLWSLLPGQHTWDQNDSIESDIGDFNADDTAKDDWHRIVWMSNSTFLVATRRHLKAFRRKGPDATCINQDVLAIDGNHTILDVRRSPIDDSCIFVTNATHVMCLRGTRNLRNVDADLSFTISLSWRHYRDPNDLTLKLSLVEEDAGLKIVLLSRATALTTVYELSSSTHEDPLQLTSFDSYQTNIITTNQGDKQRHRSDLLILPSELCGRLTLPGADLDEDSWLAKSISLGYGFYQAFTLHADLSITGQIAYAQLTRLEHGVTRSAIPELFIPAPIWSMVRSRHKMTDNARLTTDDTFLEDDDETASRVAKKQMQFRRMRRQGARHTLADLEDNPDLAISLTLAYFEITEQDTAANEGAETFGNRLCREFSARMPDVTLSSLSHIAPYSQQPVDFDKNMGIETALRQAIDIFDDNRAQRPEILPLGSHLVLGIRLAAEQTSLADRRQSLDELFVKPLSRQLATDLRNQQNLLIDDVAWRTSLASIGVRGMKHDELTIDDLQSSQQMASQRTSQLTSGSQTLTQPSVVADDDAEDADSAASTALRTQNLSNALSRLRLLTTLEAPITSQSKNEALILDHWSQGGDPLAYDYEGKTAELAGTINLQGSAMTAEVSQKVKRKKKKEQARDVKRRKLDEKVAESSQRSSQGLARPGEPVMSSQQVLGSRQLHSQAAPTSSQIFESQLTTASQPVSGVYGNRPSIGRRSLGRRGRRAGF